MRILLVFVGYVLVISAIAFTWYGHPPNDIPELRDALVRWLFPQEGHTFSPTGPQLRSLLFVGTVYYILMLLGTVSGSVFEALENANKSKAIGFRRVLRHAFTPATWQGIIVSPMIFGIIIVAGVSSSISFSTALLAYQNGFFWRATMAALRSRAAAADKP